MVNNVSYDAVHLSKNIFSTWSNILRPKNNIQDGISLNVMLNHQYNSDT